MSLFCFLSLSIRERRYPKFQITPLITIYYRVFTCDQYYQFKVFTLHVLPILICTIPLDRFWTPLVLNRLILHPPFLLTFVFLVGDVCLPCRRRFRVFAKCQNDQFSWLSSDWMTLSPLPFFRTRMSSLKYKCFLGCFDSWGVSTTMISCNNRWYRVEIISVIVVIFHVSTVFFNKMYLTMIKIRSLLQSIVSLLKKEYF